MRIITFSTTEIQSQWMDHSSNSNLLDSRYLKVNLSVPKMIWADSHGTALCLI